MSLEHVAAGQTHDSQLKTAPPSSPCATDHMDGSILRNGKCGPNSLPKLSAAVVAQRHSVARCGTLPSQKGRPIVLEVAKPGGDIDGAHLDFAQSSLPENTSERCRLADREATAFIEVSCSSVQADRCVPEVAHQLHFPGVVPDVHRHDRPRSHDASHFRERTRWLRHEVQDKARDGGVQAGAVDGQRLGVSDCEPCPCTLGACLDMCSVRRRCIYADYGVWILTLDDRLSQRAGSAAHVQPITSFLRDGYPVQKLLGYVSTPTPDIRFIEVPG